MAMQTMPWTKEGGLPNVQRNDQERPLPRKQWVTLEKLASFAAHEIRNPLAALRAMVQLAMTTHDMERRSALLKKVIDSIDELNDFLTELIILAGPKDTALVPLELPPLVNGVMRLFAVQAEVLNVRMTLDASRTLPPVWGNAPLLRHAVMNLVKNSMESMPRGGRLHVSLYDSPSDGTVRIAVEDTGTGIPRAWREQLFSGLVREKRGHGIGLPFVYRVVTDLHRGRVWFDTEEGVGTTFYVELWAAWSSPGLTSMS